MAAERESGDALGGASASAAVHINASRQFLSPNDGVRRPGGSSCGMQSNKGAGAVRSQVAAMLACYQATFSTQKGCGLFDAVAQLAVFRSTALSFTAACVHSRAAQRDRRASLRSFSTSEAEIRDPGGPHEGGAPATAHQRLGRTRLWKINTWEKNQILCLTVTVARRAEGPEGEGCFPSPGTRGR